MLSKMPSCCRFDHRTSLLECNETISIFFKNIGTETSPQTLQIQIRLLLKSSLIWVCKVCNQLILWNMPKLLSQFVANKICSTCKNLQTINDNSVQKHIHSMFWLFCSCIKCKVQKLYNLFEGTKPVIIDIILYINKINSIQVSMATGFCHRNMWLPIFFPFDTLYFILS